MLFTPNKLNKINWIDPKKIKHTPNKLNFFRTVNFGDISLMINSDLKKQKQDLDIFKNFYFAKTNLKLKIQKKLTKKNINFKLKTVYMLCGISKSSFKLIEK